VPPDTRQVLKMLQLLAAANLAYFSKILRITAINLNISNISPLLSISIKRTTEHSSFNKVIFQSQSRPLNHFSATLNRSELSIASLMRISRIPSMSSLLFSGESTSDRAF
jgi:hypothetical protein